MSDDGREPRQTDGEAVSTATIAGAERPTEDNIVPPPDTPDERSATERADDDAVESAPAPSGQAADGNEPAPLFSSEATDGYRSRWRRVQTDFVDDPRQAVRQADELVAELMQALARTFAEERTGLESQWDRGGDVSTEDLRVALQRYRSFFSRLLTL